MYDSNGKDQRSSAAKQEIDVGGAEKGMKSHSDLVAEAKELQRTSAAHGFAWRGYCDDHGEGVYDPSMHTDTFLHKAIEALQNVSPESRPPNPPGSRRGSLASTSGGGSMAAEVERIKEWQRQDPRHNELWQHYCDEMGDGMYDPNHYDVHFLRSALAVLAGRKRRRPDEGGSGGGGGSLTMQVKAYQRESKGNALLWQDYCDWFGGGVYDPSNHTATFLREAMSSIEGWRRVDWLVDRVKEWQRISKQNNETWVEYCNARGEGVYNPGSHTADFLRTAMEELGGIAAAQQRPPSQQLQTILPGSRRNSLASTAGFEGASSGGKSLLINSVKDFQRTGGAESWQQYCDQHGEGIYDPAAHSVNFLQGAMEVLSIPTTSAVSAGLGRQGSKAAAAVKEWQRQDRHNNDAWQRYCDEVGDGMYDPNHYDDAFLEEALAVLEAAPLGGGKRRRMESRADSQLVDEVKTWQKGSRQNDDVWRAMCDARGDGQYDPSHYDSKFLESALAFFSTEHSFLIDQVKQLQRSSRKCSEVWSQFCDALGDSVYDPKSHNENFLRQAVLYMERPAALSQGGGRSSGPSSDGIVAQVKEWQRQSKANNEEWTAYCDTFGEGICDPGKHSSGFLRAALRDLGIGSQSRLGNGKGGGKGGGGSSSNAGPLTETVRSLQRSSPQAGKAWRKHCDMHGNAGVYDPAAYPAQFLKDYIVVATVSAATSGY